jgi:hypothetical protein
LGGLSCIIDEPWSTDKAVNRQFPDVDEEIGRLVQQRVYDATSYKGDYVV